jgi:hypothetical protein
MVAIHELIKVQLIDMELLHYKNLQGDYRKDIQIRCIIFFDQRIHSLVAGLSFSHIGQWE